MEPIKKLYKVTLRGMLENSTGVSYGISYVVAIDAQEAYEKVRKFLDKNDLGVGKDRQLHKIELLAEATQYTDTGIILYL